MTAAAPRKMQHAASATGGEQVTGAVGGDRAEDREAERPAEGGRGSDQAAGFVTRWPMTAWPMACASWRLSTCLVAMNDRIRWLQEYQRDLERRTAEVADEIRRLQAQEGPRPGSYVV
jgi:hypothetical protein